VTVLFSDIPASTELSHRLAPELFSEILGRYFDPVRTVIERHGGTVEKFIGDAVMAFGIHRLGRGERATLERGRDPSGDSRGPARRASDVRAW
jgi:class 3 adenylate cyclase